MAGGCPGGGWWRGVPQMAARAGVSFCRSDVAVACNVSPTSFTHAQAQVKQHSHKQACPVLRVPHTAMPSSARPSMSHEPTANLHILSPTGSGRASPSPRVTRNTAEDASKKDKNFRRYAAAIERALVLWDTAQQEWADYISFLGRLLKVNTPFLWAIAELCSCGNCSRLSNRIRPRRQ